MKKVCLVSSSGGHLTQIKQLLPIINKYNYFFVTEKNETTLPLKENHKTYYLRQQERKNFLFIFTFAINILLSIVILLKEKPDILITTGAGASLPICILGKAFGAKLIFIESFAKVKSPTVTGRILYKFADKFYVQWETMLKHYPKADFKGGIY